MRKASMVLGLVICICIGAAAQKNQLSADVGVKFAPSVGTASGPNGVTKASSSLAFEVNYARTLHKVPEVVAVQVEVPFVFVTQADIKNINLNTASGYKAMFLTPSLKFQLLPDARLSPWVSFGAGFARLTASKTTLAGTPSPGIITEKPAYQGGAGLDFKVHKITFRMEGRELYTGTPNLNVSTIKLHHNIMIAGGVVLNF
jgi:hypothetical protein